MPPVHGHRGNNHDGNHERGSDRSEEAEGEEQTAADLADRGGSGERGARVEAELSEELAGASKAVASEPSEQLLGSMSGHYEPNGEPQEQNANAERLWIDCVSA